MGYKRQYAGEGMEMRLPEPYNNTYQNILILKLLFPTEWMQNDQKNWWSEKEATFSPLEV